jgi:hypothetical protein
MEVIKYDILVWNSSHGDSFYSNKIIYLHILGGIALTVISFQGFKSNFLVFKI